MKTLLLYTSPARGHLYPMMDVALELKKRGNNVIVQTMAGEKERVEREGLKHLSISSKIESMPLKDYEETNPIAQFKSAFKTWLSRAQHEIEDLKESYNKYNPDLIIADVNTWGAISFAEAQSKPWVMFTPYCLPIASPDTPAFGPGFPPPTNFLHHFRDRIVNGLVRRSVRKLVNQLNELRSDVGASMLEQYEDIFKNPNLVLYRTVEPFDYQRKDLPKNILSIGPGLWAPSAEEPSWIEELPSPRILVSVSTEEQDDGAIIETTLRAMGEENVSLIITTGALDPDKFKAPNERVRITKFLSHLKIIHKMDLLVTHGGMGATQRALAAGIPVCVIPFGRDQRETARRAEFSKAGRMIPSNKLSENRLRKAIYEAIDRKPGAEKIAKAFKNAGGAVKAVDAIDKLLL